VLEKPHKKLDVWQKSITLVKEIYELTGYFPGIENFGLTSQMRKAAISIAANISEGRLGKQRKSLFNFYIWPKVP